MHLTKSEQQIMEIFWQADHPMAQTEVIHTCEDRKWKERSIFSMLNSLMAKGVLREVGFVRSGKTYARTFEPAISHAEYLALVVAEQLPAKQFPELLASLLQRVRSPRPSRRPCVPPCVKTDPRPAKLPRQRLLRPRESSKLQQAAESGKVHNSI